MSYQFPTILPCKNLILTFFSCPVSPSTSLSVMADSQELHAVGGGGMKKTAVTTEREVSSEAERDAQALARLGKKPILKVYSGHSTGRIRV